MEPISKNLSWGWTILMLVLLCMAVTLTLFEGLPVRS